MSRLASVFLLLAFAQVTPAADLPPGALVRLGDDRYRAGGGVYQLALSPDGTRYATAREGETGITLLTVWDAKTGRPLREQKVNTELFWGFTWGSRGAFAVARRADPEAKGKPATLVPDDFRVWDFTDPKAEAPPVLDVSIGFETSGLVAAERPRGGPEYTAFLLSADGSRIAAKWKTANDRYAIHVFDLKPSARSAGLNRVGTLDLGAEGADSFRISADGKGVVTFRNLGNRDANECTATLWDVATGKPGRPVRVPGSRRQIVTPDGKSLVVEQFEEHELGFDLYDLVTGKHQALTRWRYTAAQLDGEQVDGPGGHAFSPSGRELFVAIDRKTIAIDLVAGKELGKVEGHAETPDRVAVSADGSCFATADTYGLVRLWDTNTFRALNTAPGHWAPVRYAELSPDGKRLLTWADDETVRLWDLATGKELRAFTGVVARPALTPDGTAVLHSTKKGLIVRDLQTGLETPLPEEMAQLKLRLAVFSPDGKSVLTLIDRGGGFEEGEGWDWPGGKKRFDLKVDIGARKSDGPGFSPDSSALFLAAGEPTRWDAKTGKQLPPAWKEQPRDLAYPLISLRPNPRWLLRENPPRVTEAGNDKHIPQFRLAHGGEGSRLVGNWGIALSPVGGQFAVSLRLEPGETLICEAATGSVRRTLQGHRGEIRVLGFTPDGTKLLTTGEDHTVVVWDMRLPNVPLPEYIKKETDAVKLWNMLATGKAEDAYLAMARLARDSDAAMKLLKRKLTPAAKAERDTEESKLADSRAIELLESLDTDDSRALLRELAGGHADAFRTQEAKRALERNKR